MENGPAKGEVGVTARWGISAGTTVTGTVNPDFSQVEADVAQLDVNTRFALFYPEKRPFFLEGLDYFSTPEQAVFTRTVADPSGGLKAVGKQGAQHVRRLRHARPDQQPAAAVQPVIGLRLRGPRT